MSKADFGLAFPNPVNRTPDGGVEWPDEFGVGGLTKREWFAGQALAGIVGSAHPNANAEGLARESVDLADALLAELAKEA